MPNNIRQEYELVAVDQLVEHPDNPRRGDVNAIVTAISKNGWHGALIVQRTTRRVLAGNHRLKAARALGMDAVPVLWVDVDDATAQRILVADNRASDLAAFDEEQLVALLQGTDDLAGMLFSEADLATLLSAGKEEEPDDEGEEVQAPPERERESPLGGVRSVVLPYALPDYIRVTDGLAALRKRWTLPTTAEVVQRLVAEAVPE